MTKASRNVRATRRLAVLAAACSIVALGLPAAAGGPDAARAKYSRAGVFTPLAPELRTGRNTIPTLPNVVMDAKTNLPMVLYGGTPYWNAVTISLYGLQEYNLFLRSRARERWAGAVRAANWLVRNQALDGAWDYRMQFAYPRDDVTFTVPWIAAQAQGNALSLLVRVWRRSGDARYEPAIRRALLPFRRPVGNRGIRRTLRGYEFYEGYPTTRPSLCLEDFQLALLGLYDASALSARAGRLLGRGLRALSWALPAYTDARGRPVYDLMHLTYPLDKRHEPSTLALNASLLATLAQVTGRSRLARYAQLWATAGT